MEASSVTNLQIDTVIDISLEQRNLAGKYRLTVRFRAQTYIMYV